MMDRQMKASKRMKYEEVSALDRMEETAPGSLIHS